MKKHISRVLAIILVLCLLPCWSGVAWAATAVTESSGPYDVSKIDITDSDPSTVGAHAEGNGVINVETYISSTNTGSGDAVGAWAEGTEADKTAVVNAGPVTAMADLSGTGSASGVVVDAGKPLSAAEAHISGDVTARAPESSVGVSVTAETRTTAKAETTGVLAISDNKDATAIKTENNMSLGLSVETKGNVTASATGTAIGVDITGDNKNTGGTTVDIAGNVDATSHGKNAAGVEINGNEGNVDVSVNYLYAKADNGRAVGLEVGRGLDVKGWPGTEDNTGTITANINADVDVSGKDALALDLSTNNNGSTTVTVAGDVTVSNSECAAGVSVMSENDSSSHVELQGSLDVETSTGGEGVRIDSKNSNDEVIVSGPITVTGVQYAIGAAILASGGRSFVDVGSDITVSSAKGAVGISATSENGAEVYVNMMTEGSTIESSGNGLDLSASGDGLIQTVIDGSVTAGEVGIDIGSLDDKAQLITIVRDTVSAGDAGIVVSDSANVDNIIIAVWKIEDKTDDGHVVLGKDASNNIGVTETSQKLEKKIEYLIKVDPSIAEVAGVDHAAYGGVAREGERVTIMKVNVPAGYRLTGAYGDEGRNIPLVMDENGNYYLEVPRGGGVYLSAVWEKISDGAAEAVGFDYNPYATSTVGYATVTFELNEGQTLSGNPGPIVRTVPIGSWLRLLDAPVKDGSTFELWYTDDETVTVSAPYESFMVMGDITFTAKWVGEEIVYTPTDDEIALTDSLSAFSLIPVEIEDAPETEAAEAEESTPAEESAPVEEAAETPSVDEAAPAETEEADSVEDEAAADLSEPEEAAKTEQEPAEEEPAAEPASVSEAATPAAPVEEAPAAEQAYEQAVDEVRALKAEMEATLAEMKQVTEEAAQAEKLDETLAEVRALKAEMEATLAEIKQVGEQLLAAASPEPADMMEEEMPADIVFEEAEDISGPDPAVPDETADDMNPPQDGMTDVADDMNLPEPEEKSFPAESLGSLSNGLSLPATLTIDVGGSTIELPVNVKISLAA